MAGQRQHDITGSLPLELVIHVVRFLEQAGVIRNQRVWALDIFERYSSQECLDPNACGTGLGHDECSECQPNVLYSMAIWLAVWSPGKESFFPIVMVKTL